MAEDYLQLVRTLELLEIPTLDGDASFKEIIG